MGVEQREAAAAEVFRLQRQNAAGVHWDQMLSHDNECMRPEVTSLQLLQGAGG